MEGYAANRRRFHFSLRALFVLVMTCAIPIGWIAYHLNWMRERHEALAKQVRKPYEAQKYRFPPWPLGWFGEPGTPIETLVMPDDMSDAEFAYIQALFPEADEFMRASEYKKNGGELVEVPPNRDQSGRQE